MPAGTKQVPDAMDPSLILFAIFLFLAGFNAGTMTTLQIQHYGIYPQVGKENFAEYMRANNKAARLSAILPAMLLLPTSTVLIVNRPQFMSATEAVAAFLLNLFALASTFFWQRRIQSEMAETGYDEEKTQLLISTNWIRTLAYLVQAALATTIALRALNMMS
jgi:hypothetical protein